MGPGPDQGRDRGAQARAVIRPERSESAGRQAGPDGLSVEPESPLPQGSGDFSFRAHGLPMPMPSTPAATAY
ncbi:hypothetical protein [Lysobacter gummosus]|uniref:hypothetical protein n=1 Tax=Lysobacter gummosus TaxID=262324 RepID=UPI00363FB889